MIQKVINHLYRYPLSNWKNIQRFGGLISYRKMLAGKREMIRASNNLPPVISTQGGKKVYFLTGKNYLYQTLFCAKSLVKNSGTAFHFVLIDDGSFDQLLIERVHRQMPGATIVTAATIQKNLETQLPASKYPYLHHKRTEYPHIKKLTDIHTADTEKFKLILDSDMLFWSAPTEILEWLDHPQGCLYMLDSVESYGYDKALMQSLCGAEIPELMNVGAFGVNSAGINWDEIEHWSKSLEQAEGASYFLEQALSAMLIAKEEKTILSQNTYIVNPGAQHQPHLSPVKLHHYVDLSKKYYFEEAWKKI